MGKMELNRHIPLPVGTSHTVTALPGRGGAGQEQEGAKEGLQGRSGTLADLAMAHGPPKKIPGEI